MNKNRLHDLLLNMAIFDEVAEQGSFSATAISLQMKPSSVSKRIAKPLIKVRQVLCASRQYLQQHSVSVLTQSLSNDTLTESPIYPIKHAEVLGEGINHPNDLTNYDCIGLGETEFDTQWTFVRKDERVEVMVKGRYKANHTGIRLNAVLNHIGIASFPDFSVQPQLDSGEVIAVLSDWELQSKYQGTAWLTYLPNKYQPRRLQVFVSYLLKTLKKYEHSNFLKAV